MSQQQDEIKSEEEHIPAVEAGEEAHLEDVVPSADTASADAEDGDESIESQLNKAQVTIKDYWDQMIRLRAEIDNNRKRAERDIENAHKYALKNFAENLIPVVDSMEMGQAAANTETASLESIREGTELTSNMLMQVLERSGVQQINPIGEKFDPERHQAVSMVESAEAESNSVIEVMQKGYLLNDRLIRPAMVIVAK